MNETIQFLIRNGYAVVFVWVFAEQLGLPLPAVPILMAAGVVAGAGQLRLPIVVGLAVLATLLSDFLWYEFGRRRGARVLNLVCRISLEPDSCVRRTQDIFARHGARSLVVAKFIPGLSTVAPPLAGIFRMRLGRFLLFDIIGALIWAGLFTGMGYLFSDQIEFLAEKARRLGGWLVILLIGALVAYLGWKYAQRRRFVRQLRVARITPEELKAKLDRGEDVIVVDLRHSVEFEAEPLTIPGALRLAPDELGRRHDVIPRGRELILYCT